MPNRAKINKKINTEIHHETSLIWKNTMIQVFCPAAQH